MNTTNKIKHLGILGGSFDPIHHGHIKPVIAAAKQLSLSRVLLIPTHIPAHKPSLVATPEQRATMVKLACKEDKLLQLDNRELQRNTTSYTLTTLKEIKANSQQPTHLYFFIGMDSLLSFTTWYQHTEILSLCHLVVNTRPNFNLNTANAATIALLNKHKVKTIEKLRQQPFGGIYFTQTTEENISSTQIRHQLQQGKNCTELIPEAIYRYIKKQQLYLN